MIDAFTGLQWCWLSAGALLAVMAVMVFICTSRQMGTSAHQMSTLSSRAESRGADRPINWLPILILTLGAFVLRLLMTSTDPFLYDWDEQYHALVAQHLAAHPGTPTLYDDPQLPVDITRWAHNHIWLHKPPLFLWLIALSVKLFGATPFAVKLPSIILSSLMVPALYSIVKRISNERAGFIAALLLATHSWSIQLVSGFRNTDHNDVIFAAFVLFSFWAWIRYTDSERMRDAVLAGLLVGCAVLVKWLPGILVFGPWGLWMLQRQNRNDKLKWLHFTIAVCVALALVLPWYIHIYRNFPAEAAYESHYNFLHMSIAMEGHEGPWYYHFGALRELLGWTLAILSVPAILLFAVQDTKHRRALYMACAVLFFVVFYSIAKTKMPLFMLPVIPFLFAAIAVLIDKAGDALFRKKAVAGVVLSCVALFVLDVPHLVTNHSGLSELAWYRDEMWGVRNKAEFYLQEKAKSADAGKRVVIFNFPENERAAFMFYTGDIVYTETPSIDSVHAIQQKGFVTGVYDNRNFPEAYAEDATIRRYFSHLNP